MTEISNGKREAHLEATLEKLLGVSEAFLQVDSMEVNYQEIADAFKDISGARFVAFNFYTNDGSFFTTMATSGLSRHHSKITSLLGFDLQGKTWPHDPVRHEKIRDQVLTRFDRLSDLNGDVIPGFIISRIEQLFSLGEVFVMRIMKGEQLTGDFTFVMPMGEPFKEVRATEIFSRQIELLLAQRNAEQRLLQQSDILKHALEHQRILSDVAVSLNTLVDFDQRISDCIRIIGDHTGVSRVYLFENSADGTHTSNTYEWCNEGVTPEIANLQHIAFSSMPSIEKALREEGMVYTHDINDLDEGTRAIMEAQHIKSVLIFPIYVQGAFFGFIGFDECADYKYWDNSELELLRTLSGIISHAYERRFMERAIEEERDKARQASQAKSEFLANMSHEIRTPMNAILGFSEALRDRVTDAGNRKMVDSILSGGKLLLSLLNDILDLSKIEAGKLELYIQPVSPAAILEETRMLFSEKAKKKGLQFMLEVKGEMPVLVDMDETRLKQIIFNLVSNAIKFTHSGYVKLSVAFDQQQSGRGKLQIAVEDTGIGIPEDLAGHIFEDFNQLSPENTRKYEGTGLGLSICKRLTEKMNGKIDVSSTLGRGSVFRVEIPNIPISQQAEAARLHTDMPGIRFRRSLVLVIDDVAADIEIIESLLISLGLETSHALGGKEALRLLAQRKPALILLDTRMPDMNGYEFLQTIKAQEAYQDIPVVAYSATIPGYGNNPLSRLFSGHIQKPVRRHVLINELSKHLPHATDHVAAADVRQGLPLAPLQPEEVPGNCHDIWQLLQKSFLPQWNRIKDQLVIFKIEEFAKKLELFATEQQFPYLLDYAEKLSQQANSLDIESMKETMSRFPYICSEVESICKSHK